jgi:hypothetical protein
MGDLIAGTSSESFNKSVTVKCNKAGWTLTVCDNRTDLIRKGHMDNGVTAMVNPIEVKGGDQLTYAYLNTSVTLEDGIGAIRGITTISDVKFRQATDWTDTPDDYGITVTFTATTS